MVHDGFNCDDSSIKSIKTIPIWISLQLHKTANVDISAYLISIES